MDERSDVFGAGVVLYALLTMCCPFGSCEPEDRVDIAPVAPSRLVSGIPESVDRAVLRALAPRMGDRHRTAREFADELVDALDYQRSGIVMVRNALLAVGGQLHTARNMALGRNLLGRTTD